jgi:hypothetical protein
MIRSCGDLDMWSREFPATAMRRTAVDRSKDSNPNSVAQPASSLQVADGSARMGVWMSRCQTMSCCRLATRRHSKPSKPRCGPRGSRVARTANTQMIELYWRLGRLIVERQLQEGRRTRVIARLAADLQTEFPDVRGFSAGNLDYMRRFATAWPEPLPYRS